MSCAGINTRFYWFVVIEALDHEISNRTNNRNFCVIAFAILNDGFVRRSYFYNFSSFLIFVIVIIDYGIG